MGQTKNIKISNGVNNKKAPNIIEFGASLQLRISTERFLTPQLSAS